MVGQLALVGIHTHMHSSPLKAIGVAPVRQATLVQFQRPEIIFGRCPLLMVQPKNCIRLVGRNALPHIFQREDYIKLLSACRRASSALGQVKLPSHYPILMYVAAGGGMLRWTSGFAFPHAVLNASVIMQPPRLYARLQGTLRAPHTFYNPSRQVGQGSSRLQ